MDDNVRIDTYEEEPDSIVAGPEERPRAAFLLSVKDSLSAEAYEEMLKKNGIDVVIERLEPTGPYAAMSIVDGELNGSANLYVSSQQLEQARRLIDDFENSPVVFNTPPPKFNQKSRINQLVFAIVIVLIFVIPIGISILIIGQRVFRAFIK